MTSLYLRILSKCSVAAVDECVLGLDECVAMATCVDQPVSYYCECPSGYVRRGRFYCVGESRWRSQNRLWNIHDDVIKWKHFPRYSPFVRGIHRSPVNSPHKGQWHGALMFSLIWVWISDWVNNREVGDLRRYRTNYDVIVMSSMFPSLVLGWSSY